MLASNRNGIPIGQVLLPGRDEGHNLLSTSMAIRPGADDLYIVTSDGNGGQGATIFHAKRSRRPCRSTRTSDAWHAKLTDQRPR